MASISLISINVLRRQIPMWKMLWVGGVFLLISLLSSYNLIWSGILVGGAWFVVLTYYYPMPAIFFLMVLFTNVFMFVDMQHIPYWQIGQGLRMNITDSLLFVMFAIAVVKLYQRRERPLFLKPILLIFGVILIPFIPGLLLGATNLDIGMNCFRVIFSYVFYFILIASIDSPRRLHILIRMIFVIIVVSVGIQAVEAILGRRLTLGLIGGEYYNITKKIIVNGQIIPYLWNRTTVYLYVGLCLSLGATFSVVKSYRFLPFALLGILGFVIALIRTWYILIAIGVIIILILQKRFRIRTIITIVLVVLGTLGLITIIGILNPVTYGGSLLNILIGRLCMINSNTSSFTGRIEIWQGQLAYFWQSSLFGYGMSPEFQSMQDTDTGIINTLLQFGIVGAGAFLFLIVNVLHIGYKLWRNLESSLEYGYTAGILGCWSGMLIGYLFNWDFFTRLYGISGVTLVMAIIDRIWFFHSENRLIG
jgi:hypothetical protein